MNTIKECFKTILEGNKEQSRQAARRVRKLVYSAAVTGRDKYDEIKELVNSAAVNYKKISEDWRQENYVVAMSVICFLHDKDLEPDFLFPWFFQLLQHPRGNIRYAAVRMISNELGPLTYHMRFPNGERLDGLAPGKANIILRTLTTNLDNLMAAYWKPEYRKYKYIQSLPVSVYKSVQLVWGELQEMCELDDRSWDDGSD